jgi:hypothetical protein
MGPVGQLAHRQLGKGTWVGQAELGYALLGRGQ